MSMQVEAHMPHAHSPSPSVPAFLIKTYQLVDDASTDHIISWGEDYTTFVVWNPSEMARLVLPCFFKPSNLTNFVRRLNLYGFRKVAQDRWEFANEFFRKGAKHLLCKIQRRKTANAALSGAPLKNSADDHRCVSNDMMPFTPSSSSSAMISPVEEVLGSPTLDISSENEKLARGGHAKLLSQLTLIKCLCEESLCIIQQQNPVNEGNGPQKCLPGSRACQCQHLQHQHSVKFPFKVLDESSRKESVHNNTGSLLLENRDTNRLSMSSIQDLQMVSTRENRDKENRDKSGPSMKSVHTPCVCNDLRSLIPSSPSPMMAPAPVEVGREPSSLLNENNRLRRDNTILLSELTHVRKLYNEALSIIKIQKGHLEEAIHLQQHPSGLKIINSQSRDMHGPFINSSVDPSLNMAAMMQHKRDFTDSPSCNNDAYRDAKKLRGCQDACKLTTQMDITGEKDSSKQSVNKEIKGQVRLFGVPLQCSKKWRHEEDDDADELMMLNGIADTDTGDDNELMIIKVVTEDRAFEKMPSLKSITVDSLEQLE